MYNETYKDTKGVIRWISNGWVPFADTLGEWWENGLISWTDLVISNIARHDEEILIHGTSI